MEQTKEIVQDWLERVKTEGRNLTPWEQRFIESIAEQFDEHGTLSDTQVEILEGIYARRTR